MLRTAAGTRCNITHCGWYAQSGQLQYAHADPLAWRREGVRELRVTVASAGRKGLGVFAAQPAGPGRFVGDYEGEILTLRELRARYVNDTPVYVYRLSKRRSIDARHSTHFSRYMNHDWLPNVHAVVSAAAQRISFFATRPLSVGTELTIDYGTSYWAARDEVPENEPRLMRPPQRLPARLQRDAPLMVEEASAALALAPQGDAAAFLAARSRARGLASVQELVALPFAMAGDTAARVQSLLLHLASAHGARTSSVRPSGADHRLAQAALRPHGLVTTLTTCRTTALEAWWRLAFGWVSTVLTVA